MIRELLRNEFEKYLALVSESFSSKILDCWELAAKRGNWNEDELLNIPFTLLIPDCPYSLLQHTAAVTGIALRSGKTIKEYHPQIELNQEYIIVGGLLHDVGKLLEYSSSEGRFMKSETGKLLRHPFSGAILAAETGFPAEIVHIIATHAHEGDSGYRSPESIAVHHADFIYFETIKAILNIK
ncbi:HD domain-containing protein [bacterium]|nr:HD domain-containing protein [bacterium]